MTITPEKRKLLDKMKQDTQQCTYYVEQRIFDEYWNDDDYTFANDNYREHLKNHEEIFSYEGRAIAYEGDE